MISSRRLAREWALKILYQHDVGKSSFDEVLDTPMERLRREFVLRGSRTASGSTAEELCLEVVTAALRDWLQTMTPAVARTIGAIVIRILSDAPYWQEVRLERAFRTAAPGVHLIPARLLTPSSRRDYGVETTAAMEIALSRDEGVRLQAFVMHVCETLEARLETEMRRSARAFASEMAEGRPKGASSETVQGYLREQREHYNRVQQERWRRIGLVVQKQTDDWLRTASFVDRLVRGVHERQEEIDTAIEGLAAGWKLTRQVAVDRNILRLAGFEMLYLSNVPTGASINEAVELAKKYSTAESGRFVNGVLGALAALAGNKPFGPDEPAETDDVLDLPDISAIEENE